jgi:hypothetical protein
MPAFFMVIAAFTGKALPKWLLFQNWVQELSLINSALGSFMGNGQFPNFAIMPTWLKRSIF